MNFGLFEIALLAGSVATAAFGAWAALARRRSAPLLALNWIFAACLGYFVVQGLRFGGGAIILALAALCVANVTVAWAMVERAERVRPPSEHVENV